MTYLVKNTPKQTRMAYITGTGNVTYNFTGTGQESRKLTLPTLVKDANASISLSSNSLTLGNKRYIIFLRPFADESNPSSATNTLDISFEMYLNDVKYTKGVDAISSGASVSNNIKTQTTLGIYEIYANANDKMDFYLNVTKPYSPSNISVYYQNGAFPGTFGGSLGIFIFEVDK